MAEITMFRVMLSVYMTNAQAMYRSIAFYCRDGAYPFCMRPLFACMFS